MDAGARRHSGRARSWSISSAKSRSAAPTRELIPGLAAQIPDSPLVQWLHAADEPIPGELARRRRRHRGRLGDLVAEDAAGRRVLLDRQRPRGADALDVRRRAARRRARRFVLDQGGKVSHFNYFSNERTAEAIVNALTQDMPAGFRVDRAAVVGGRIVDRRACARSRGADDGKPASDKPAVFVLPGILGSNLKVDGKRIWLGWRLDQRPEAARLRPARPDGVEPDGPIGMSLRRPRRIPARQTHEVIEFAFDWRRPIEDEARRLADAVEAALDARAANGQPVRLARALDGRRASRARCSSKARRSGSA